MAKNKWLRILGGVLTGGLSELGVRAYEKAKNSADGPVQAKQNIVDMIRESGLSEAEFFQLHPELQNQYYEADSYGKGAVPDLLTSFGDNNIITKTKDAYKGSKLEENIDKITEGLTGDRDLAENERNRSFQAEQADIARQWEAEQARVAREWDSIGAQMERAAAAGVNPISIAMQNGGINSSATTSIPASPGYPTGSAGLMHSGLPDIAAMIFNGVGTLAENRLKQTQADDITIMRKYNIAEKIATTDHLRELCKGVNLSNVAQTIQNRWLDAMNQATYDNMLLDKGVKRSTILKERSVADLNVQQVAQIKQSMEMALKEFNAKLPLELQLMESEINLKNQSVQDVYYECCLRYLQMFEQENRNRQSAAEAEGAEIETSVARETMEDAITQFHNSMVKAAAEAGISLYDYMYYGYSYSGAFDFIGKAQRRAGRNKKGYYQNVDWNRNQIFLPAQTAQPMQ